MKKAFVLVCALAALRLSADLIAYPPYPERIERDYAYAVRVTQGETRLPLVVYNHCEKSVLRERTHGGDVNRRFCEFAFSGAGVRLDVRVTEDVKCYKVFPARLGLRSAFRDGVVSVWLDKPACFGLQLNDSDKTILSVFADAPETDAPRKGDPGVMFVEGWKDAPSADGVIETGPETKEIYLAPGAVLNARLRVRGKGTRLHGRGMVLDPMSDIFRYDQTKNAKRGLVRMEAEGTVAEGVKLVDARTFNFMGSRPNQVWRNVKVLASMMCSDGFTLGSSGHLVENAWVYVGDNALVISSLRDSVFRNVALGTSCAAVFPQGSNRGIRLENVDVFRADDGFINNSYNGVLRRNNKWQEMGSGFQRKEPGPQDLPHQTQDFLFRDLTAVDCTLFPHFFSGRNMGTRPKSFVFDGCSVPFSAGREGWRSVGKTDGVAISVRNDPKKWLVTDNYAFAFTNLFIGGEAREFAASAVVGCPTFRIDYARTAAVRPLPRTADRHEVNWTCPYKVTRGGRVVRDWRKVDLKKGARTLPVGEAGANLVAEDGTKSRSLWQRVPSWMVKLEAMSREEGHPVYRLVQCERGAGMQAVVTEEFLERGNGTWRVSFDMASKSETPFQLYVRLVSNERQFARGLTPAAPTHGWQRYMLDIKTDFDLSVSDLVALELTATKPADEIRLKNLSLTRLP